jgi:hypothetical protein
MPALGTTEFPAMTNVRIVGGRATTHDKIPHDMASEALHFSDDDINASQADEPREPSVEILLSAIGDAGIEKIRAAEAARAALSHFAILYVRVPNDWDYPAALALDAILGEGKVRVLDPGLRSLKGDNLNSGVLAYARNGHTALIDDTEEGTDAGTLDLADLTIDLRRIGCEHIEGVIRNKFGDPRFKWPRDLSARKFRPIWLDYAAGRARTANEVVTLLRSQIEESKRAKLRDDAEASRETARKAANGRGAVVIRPLRPTEPKLESLEGYGAAKAWGAEFLLDMLDYAKKRIAWADVDAGALLVGLPGTGKTLFASALAASAGLPLFATSYATWQASGEAHLGTLIKAMRATFEAASAHAPCIVFIDEIDAIPRRDSAAASKSDGWWTAIVTALLECLDGTLRREGVVVLAACNDASGLDPAIVRSGRLDRRFEISLPDAAALSSIFAHHAPDLDAAVIEPVATALAGMASGADVARYAREAKRHARRAGRPLSGEDILTVALPPETRSPAIVWRTAVHEAGHAMAYLAAGRIPRALSLAGIEGAHGFVMPPAHVQDQGRLVDIEAMVMPYLAGRAAEEVLLGDASAGASSDLDRATQILAGVEGGFGLGGYLTPGGPDRTSVEIRIRRLYGEALMLVVTHRSTIVDLARLAIEKRVLGETALREFAQARGLA